MKADEIISKAELFVMNFVTKMKDQSEQPARKQVFFMDSQEDLTKYMGALQKIATAYEGEENLSEDDALILDKANELITKLRETVTEYKKELTISDSITEEDTTTQLTQEKIAEAMKTNKTTQEIAANMSAIAESQKIAAQVPYNYILMCDGQVNLIAAQTKEQLNTTMNSIANNGNYKDIALFQMQLTPVPVKRVTQLSV